ncbi:MAG: hypothetical protein WCH75_18815 [Candidatus Binatia bacterium]|jgi:hypothetical protein
MMFKLKLQRVVMVALMLGVFALGYFCGTVGQRQADAQLGGLLEQAGKAGGPMGSIAQLGSSIVEMQDHVTGLQKNIDSLKKIQSALGGK